MLEQAAETGLNPDQLEEKRKARLERFGDVDLTDVKKAAGNGGGHNNKRKQKQ